MSKTSVIFVSTFSVLLIASLLNTSSFGDEQLSNTEANSIDANIEIEKTVITFSVPEDNISPWGFVEGKIANPVPDYPVIIQFYDNDDQINGNNLGAVHFAQIPVNEDGTYEYKFRVRNVDGDEITNIFEGDYTVKIFKVVYLYPNLSLI